MASFGVGIIGGVSCVAGQSCLTAVIAAVQPVPRRSCVAQQMEKSLIHAFTAVPTPLLLNAARLRRTCVFMSTLCPADRYSCHHPTPHAADVTTEVNRFVSCSISV